jgi:hypothetical protein
MKRKFKENNFDNDDFKNKIIKKESPAMYNELFYHFQFSNFPREIINLMASFISIYNYLNVCPKHLPLHGVNDHNIRQMLNDCELNADAISDILIRTGAKLTGSSILHNLWSNEDDADAKSFVNQKKTEYNIDDDDKTQYDVKGERDWQNNDFDFFILDSKCYDQRVFKCELDDYLESLTLGMITKGSDSLIKNRMELNQLRLITNYKKRLQSIHPQNDNEKYKCMNNYFGTINYNDLTSEEKEKYNKNSLYFDSQVDLDGLEIKNGENVWKMENKYRIRGVNGNRKYHFPFFSIDVVYVDSAIYHDVDEFIDDTFDFDFLKNSWNGQFITIMKPYQFKMRESLCLQPLPTINANIEHYPDDTFLTEESEKFGFLDIDRKAIEWWKKRVLKRCKMYSKRGFTISNLSQLENEYGII